jgi:DNA-binding response OmpR family regulator
MKTLLIESQRSIRDLVKVALQQFADAEVETAEDNWALEMAREKAYDMLVVSDHLAHPGDGLLLLKDLREQGFKVPAVVISRDRGEALGRERSNLNIAAVVNIPIDTVDLFKSIVSCRMRAEARR